MFHRIAEIRALPNYRLWSRFADGTEITYDVSALFDRLPAFRSLENNPGLFDRVHIDGRGYGICWNDDLDLDAEELYQNGILLNHFEGDQAGMNR